MTGRAHLRQGLVLGLLVWACKLPGGIPLHAGRDVPPPGLETSALAVGAPAPDFTLLSSQGELVHLSELMRQGPLVAVFYRGRWCPHCRRQLGQLQAQATEFEKRRARVIAISVDTPEQTLGMAKEEHLTMLLLADPDLSTIRAWGVADEQNEIAWPAVFIIGRDGRIAWRSLSESYRERPEVESILKAIPP